MTAMRVLVLRPRPEAEETAAALAALGYRPLLAPMLEVRALSHPPIDPARYAAVLLTSANAVRALADDPALPGLRPLPVFAVGAHTARAAEGAGFALVEAGETDGAALVARLPRRLARGTRVLYPAGRDRAFDPVPVLAAAGIAVDVIAVYAAEPVPDLPSDVVAAIAGGAVDAVLTGSARTSAAFAAALGRAGLLGRLEPLLICGISENAVVPLRRSGASRVRIASRPDQAGLLACLGGGG